MSIDRIPMPASPMESMERGTRIGGSILESLMGSKMLPYELALKKAQAEEHSGKALQSQMMSQLLNQFLGGGNLPTGNMPQMSGNQPYQLTDQDRKGIGGLTPGQSYTIPHDGLAQNVTPNKQNGGMNPDFGKLLVSGLLGLPTHNVEGNIVTPFGQVKVGENAQEKREAERKSKFQENLSSHDIKQTENWNNIVTSNEQIMPALENIQEISANPIFQNMYKNPEYFGKDIDYLRRFGSDDEKKLLNTLTTNQKSLYTNMGDNFKGSFREFEKKIFDKAIPDEHDTLQGIQAKTNAMIQLKELGTKRAILADQIFRSMEGKISPGSAMQLAKQQISGKDVMKKVEDQFKQLEKEQSNLKSKLKQVNIYDPNNNLVGTATEQDASNFLKHHRGYYKKAVK
jgi:hypothetical protein